MNRALINLIEYPMHNHCLVVENSQRKRVVFARLCDEIKNFLLKPNDVIFNVTGGIIKHKDGGQLFVITAHDIEQKMWGMRFKTYETETVLTAHQLGLIRSYITE